MINLTRLPEPDILVRNKETWRDRYLARRAEDSTVRPPSSQYGHEEIRNVLEAMSLGKCFYCEQKLSDAKAKVDHYIEIAEQPELAFEWINLYLSCSDCNRNKLSNRILPVTECIDPCEPSLDPKAHLIFDDEVIKPKLGSNRGKIQSVNTVLIGWLLNTKGVNISKTF